MTEADRNRPFCHNSDAGRNRSFYYDGRGRETDSFATIQMLVGTFKELRRLNVMSLLYGISVLK